MALQCARFSSGPDIVRAATNSPPLRRGSHGDGVHVLQLALIGLGFAKVGHVLEWRMGVRPT